MSKLSKHQQRVIAALAALEKAHGWRWWPRDTIGAVVQAGGYHRVIHVATIAVLKDRGLVLSERASWFKVTRCTVRCGCGLYCWGLTAAGRKAAGALKVQLGEESTNALEFARHEVAPPLDLDEVEQQRRIKKRWEDDDDDDDDDDPVPFEPAPRSPGELCPA